MDSTKVKYDLMTKIRMGFWAYQNKHAMGPYKIGFNK